MELEYISFIYIYYCYCLPPVFLNVRWNDAVGHNNFQIRSLGLRFKDSAIVTRFVYILPVLENISWNRAVGKFKIQNQSIGL